MINCEEYQKCLEDIFHRFPSVQQAGFGNAYKPGLAHMEQFADLLGRPERNFRTIHVAGTNGKGSVSSMLASMLSAAGLRTGLYTSPHLLDFRERLKVLPGAGLSPATHATLGTLSPELVSEAYVYEFITRWRETFEKLDLSFFEITTGMAFRWFADEKVDVAVIEVGLGGRLDSTNIIRPDLSVITSIGLDHCQLLGHTRAAVAGEKAGIIKPGIPALGGEDDAETAAVFEAKAAAEQAPLAFAPREEPALWNQRRELLAEMDLRGDYQSDNLRTALVARDLLLRDPFYAGLADEAAVTDALLHTAQRAGLRARWEKLSSRPDVLCDIAHNAPALKRNFAQLESLLRSGTYARLLIVYAVMADKDLEAIFPYFPREASWFFATPTTPRALPARQILERYRAYCQSAGIPAGEACAVDSVPEAVRKALAAADPETLLYIGGSTFAVADALPLFGHIK